MASTLAFESFLEQCEESIQCPICTETKASMRILPCGHAFCEDCLHKLKRHGGNIECPMDREKIPLPKDKIAKLPRQTLVDDFKDLITSGREILHQCTTEGTSTPRNTCIIPSHQGEVATAEEHCTLCLQVMCARCALHGNCPAALKDSGHVVACSSQDTSTLIECCQLKLEFKIEQLKSEQALIERLTSNALVEAERSIDYYTENLVLMKEEKKKTIEAVRYIRDEKVRKLDEEKKAAQVTCDTRLLVLEHHDNIVVAPIMNLITTAERNMDKVKKSSKARQTQLSAELKKLEDHRKEFMDKVKAMSSAQKVAYGNKLGKSLEKADKSIERILTQPIRLDIGEGVKYELVKEILHGDPVLVHLKPRTADEITGVKYRLYQLVQIYLWIVSLVFRGFYQASLIIANGASNLIDTMFKVFIFTFVLWCIVTNYNLFAYVDAFSNSMWEILNIISNDLLSPTMCFKDTGDKCMRAPC